MKRVVLAGSTGLVGAACMRLLGDAPGVVGVTALVRHAPTSPPRSERVRVAIVDFDHLDRHESLFDGDAIVCALGTTMRAAGSREAFRRVDYEYPLEMARLGRRRGVAHFLLVSALGAHPSSRVFYNRVKGEVERALEDMGFPSLTIVRPSILLGDRGERRLAESIGQWVSRLAPARWRGVPAERVAATLVRCVENQPPGLRVIENAELLRSPSA